MTTAKRTTETIAGTTYARRVRRLQPHDVDALGALLAAEVEFDNPVTGRHRGPLIESWDGRAWSVSAIPAGHDSLSGCWPRPAPMPGRRALTGPLARSSSAGTARRGRWPRRLSAGANGLAAISAVTATDIWAVGDRGLAGGTVGTLVEHYTQQVC